MTLKTQMAADLSVFFNTDEFAENVIYTPSGDFPRTIVAIVDRGQDLASASGSKPVMAVINMEIKQSDIEAPGYDDVVEIDSVEWRVQRIEKGDAGLTWLISLKRDQRPAFRR